MKKTLSIVLIVLIVAVAAIALVSCKDTTTNYPHAERYSVGGATYSPSQVTGLDIAWDEGTIILTASTEYTSVTVSEENTVEGDAYALHQYVDSDGILWVKPYAADVDTENLPQFEKKILTVTMPKYMLEKVTLENHGVDYTVDGIMTKELTTYNTGYATRINNAVVLNKVNMKCQGITGDLSINGQIGGEITMDANGSITLNTAVVPTKINLSGKKAVTVYVPESIGGFTADITTISKVVCTDFDIAASESSTEAGTTRYVYGAGTVPMTLKCENFSYLFDDKVYNTVTIAKYVPAV